MDLKISGKRALVFGGSSGLGFSIAKTLIQEGAQVAICSKNEEKLNQAAAQMKAKCAVPGDLTVAGSAQKVVQTVIERLGGLDILVCNTGGPAAGKFTAISADQWQEGFQSLWMSTIEAIRASLPGMTAQKWGRILLVTSVAAKEAMPLLTVSNGLRSGLLGLTKTISNEIASSGVTINSILPGYTRTDRLKHLNIPEETMIQNIPAGRLGEPEEFAALAAFLASDQAAYITGQAISCDGGYMRSI